MAELADAEASHTLTFTNMILLLLNKLSSLLFHIIFLMYLGAINFESFIMLST